MCYTEAEQVFHDFPEKCGKTEGLFHRKGAASCLNARNRPGNYSLCPSTRSTQDILRKFILNENVKIIIFYTDKEDYKKKIINLIKIIGQDELVKRTGGKNKTIVFQKINTCTLESDSMREK